MPRPKGSGGIRLPNGVFPRVRFYGLSSQAYLAIAWILQTAVPIGVRVDETRPGTSILPKTGRARHHRDSFVSLEGENMPDYWSFSSQCGQFSNRFGKRNCILTE